MDEVPELREIGTDQREVMVRTQMTDLADPIGARVIVHSGAQGVAGVGGVGDDRVVAQHFDDLADRARLRVFRVKVEVSGHQLSLVQLADHECRSPLRLWSASKPVSSSA